MPLLESLPILGIPGIIQCFHQVQILFNAHSDHFNLLSLDSARQSIFCSYFGPYFVHIVHILVSSFLFKVICLMVGGA
jgi:hypothetical protein